MYHPINSLVRYHNMVGTVLFSDKDGYIVKPLNIKHRSAFDRTFNYYELEPVLVQKHFVMAHMASTSQKKSQRRIK